MSKVRILTITTIGLLLLNIAMVVFFFLGRPPRPDFEGPKTEIIEKLAFDNTQIEAYEKLINSHKSNIVELDEKMKVLKQELYLLLGTDASDLERNEGIQKIIELQKEVELIHYNHFSDIKKLCKGEQIEKFNELSKELAQLFAPKGPPRK
jgi:hypothetical protein